MPRAPTRVVPEQRRYGAGKPKNVAGASGIALSPDILLFAQIYRKIPHLPQNPNIQVIVAYLAYLTETPNFTQTA